MKKKLTTLEQFCADNHLHLLACYMAAHRPPGESASLMLFASGEGEERFYLWGYYEEVKHGWDWFDQSDDEDKARSAFLACLGIQRRDA